MIMSLEILSRQSLNNIRKYITSKEITIEKALIMVYNHNINKVTKGNY